MKALIVDPAHTGHHLQYVGVLTRGLLELGVEVELLLGREALGSDELQTHLGDLLSRVKLSAELDPIAGPAVADWKRTAAGVVQHVAQRRVDRVFVPYVDGLAQVLGMPGSGAGPLRRVPVEGLLMRGNWAYPQSGWRGKLRAQLSRRLVVRGPWDLLHLLDPLPFFAMRSSSAVRSGRMRLIPEAVEPLPTMPSHEARRSLGLPEDGRWLVVTGMQDRRKGSDRLVRAFLSADKPADARLLLAGKASVELVQQLKQEAAEALRDGTVVMMNRYLSEEEHAWALSAADVMASPHPDAVGSSGLLVRAAALRKPVLASDFGWVGWATRTFGLGTTVNVRDPDSYAQALSRFLHQPPAFGNDLTDRFLRYHRLENHVAHWLAQTRRSLGLPAGPELCRWEDLFDTSVGQKLEGA